MKSIGMARKVDDLGRIVIPSTMRRALGISEGDQVEIHLDGDRVVVAKAADRCTFCGGDRHLELLHGKPVCWSCLGALRAKAAAVPDDGGDLSPYDGASPGVTDPG